MGGPYATYWVRADYVASVYLSSYAKTVHVLYFTLFLITSKRYVIACLLCASNVSGQDNKGKTN